RRPANQTSRRGCPRSCDSRAKFRVSSFKFQVGILPRPCLVVQLESRNPRNSRLTKLPVFDGPSAARSPARSKLETRKRHCLCATLPAVPRGSRPLCAVQPGPLPAFLLARDVDGGVASTPEMCRLPVRAHLIQGEKHMKFTKLTPNLVVRDVQAAVHFYQSL